MYEAEKLLEEVLCVTAHDEVDKLLDLISRLADLVHKQNERLLLLADALAEAVQADMYSWHELKNFPTSINYGDV